MDFDDREQPFRFLIHDRDTSSAAASITSSEAKESP
jgi:hypothetical protein